jgi:hypothetical protein
VPVRYAVLPLPVIDWTVVVKADDPTRKATRGRLRELRRKRRVTAGLTVWRRGSRGLQGRATYYSVLAALAARIWQEGHDEEAAGLEQAAAELESRFSARLEVFLSGHSLSQLPQAEFFDELTAATARSLAGGSRVFQTLLAAARVDEIEDDVAHLEGSSPRGGQVTVDLPRALVERQSLKVGDLVWVFSRIVGDAALVELLPATRITLQADFPSHVPGGLMSLVDVDPMGRLGEGSDGLTGEERAEYAQQFRTTVGADLSADDLEELKADATAERMPRRRLRPAG